MKTKEKIDKLKTLLTACPGLINLSEKDCEVLGKLIEAYGEQEFDRGKEYASQSKWISVEDRLPELKRIVLLWFPYNLSQATGYLREDGQFIFDKRGLHGLPSMWQPLPQPPIS